MTDHRQQVYKQYASTTVARLAPADITGFDQRAPYLNWIICRHFPPDRKARVFELGCGHGALIYFMLQNGYADVAGVDISEEQVEEAHRLGINEVQLGDLLETLKQMPDASQDVIVAYDVIEHFTKDELMPFGQEVLRALRPGGKWILHTPNGEGLFGLRAQYWDFTHMTGFSRNSITQFLKTVGFSAVACYEDKIVIHGIKSTVRSAVWAVTRLGLRLILAAETGDASNRYVLTQNMLTIAVK